MTRTKALAPAAALILLLGAVTEAQAVPILRLTTDSGSISVMDGSVADWNVEDGAVTFIGAVDGWTVNVTTGFSKPLLGSDVAPSLDLNSVNLSSYGSGTLRIELTDTDFLLSGPVRANAQIGGVTAGSLSYQTYYDAGNTAFGQGGLLHDLGTFGAGAFSASGSTSLLMPALYSLTLLVEIMHPTAGVASSFNATLQVPEPSSIALLGAGLLLLAGTGRRRPARP
jgi:hypothetical protein